MCPIFKFHLSFAISTKWIKIKNCLSYGFQIYYFLFCDSYIAEWAKETSTAIPANAKAVDMDKCCFNDLKVRLGCPYVYLHQGACEHLVVFKDIRYVCLD